MNTKKIFIEGMHCASCVKIITDEFIKVDGIQKVSIDLSKKEANIQYDSKDIDLEYLDSLIKPFGFKIIISI